MFTSLFQRFIAMLVVIIGLFRAAADPVETFFAGVTVPQESVNSYLAEHDAMTDTYAATDGLGRVVAMNDTTGGVRTDRFVGLFYSPWHVYKSDVQKIVNINSVVENDPSAANDPDCSAWGPLGTPHFWNEPVYGYYKTDDRWVLRRQAELLAAAGVDVIIFDTTNGTFTFKESYDVIFDVFAQARAQGVKTPKIAFLCPFKSGDDTAAQLHTLYEDIYSRGRYQDLWFYWKGKPLIMAYPDSVRNSKEKEDRQILSFFTFRPGIGVYTKSSDDINGSSALQRIFAVDQYWSWLSVYPQARNYSPDGTLEEMAVSTAQNYSAAAGLTAMNGSGVFGRTYTYAGYDTRDDAKLRGANFAEQCEYALEQDPEFVFITGWNEWVADRAESWQGVTNAFPDEFNDTYSRDIEPSYGDLKDHYYYQMVDFIRKYKGTRPVEPDTEHVTVNDFADWDKVTAVDLSYAGNTFDRDSTGYAGVRYTDQSGRNDIVQTRMTSDSNNLYFLVECAADITDSSAGNWMRLLLSTGEGDKNWESYEYIINRLSPDGETAYIERSSGGWNWESCGTAGLSVDGKRLMLTVPKTALGISGGSFTVDYKWTDNTLSTGDIMDVYKYGDTAPAGRFNYRYISQ